MKLSRRSLLAGTSSVLGVAVAGCSSRNADGAESADPGGDRSEEGTTGNGRGTGGWQTTTGSEQATTTVTDGTTGSPEPTATVSPDALAFEATVRSQPSKRSPGRITTTLRNRSDGPVSVGYGESLLRTDSARRLQRPDDVALGNPEVEYVDGCWRRAPGTNQTIHSILNTADLAPGGEMSDTYSLFARPDAECPSPGTYVYESTVLVESRDAAIAVDFEIREDGLAVEGTGPRFV